MVAVPSETGLCYLPRKGACAKRTKDILKNRFHLRSEEYRNIVGAHHRLQRWTPEEMIDAADRDSLSSPGWTRWTLSVADAATNGLVSELRHTDDAT